MSDVVRTYCPNCDLVVDAALVQQEETLNVRNEAVEYVASIAKCPRCHEAIGDLKVEKSNLECAYDIYRNRHNIPSPSEIHALRSEYGLSLREFSRFLGFGEQTVARYEAGSLPDIAHGNVLRTAEIADGAERLLEASSQKLTKRSVERIKAFIERHRDSEDVLEKFGVTDEQLEAWEADAARGIFHGEPRGEVVDMCGVYRHFKGKYYKVFGTAIHSETEELLVIYQTLYGDRRVYARPADMFFGPVDKEKYPDVKQERRFEGPLSDEEIKAVGLSSILDKKS